MKARLIEHHIGTCILVPAEGLAPRLLLEILADIQANIALIDLTLQKTEGLAAFRCRVELRVRINERDNRRVMVDITNYINANLPEA
jgi:hypothetical protein